MVHADALVDRLDRQLRLLAKEPMIGRARDEVAAGLRSIPFGRYVIFYQPIDNDIQVVRVLHGARDGDAQFGDSSKED